MRFQRSEGAVLFLVHGFPESNSFSTLLKFEKSVYWMNDFFDVRTSGLPQFKLPFRYIWSHTRGLNSGGCVVSRRFCGFAENKGGRG